MAAIYYVLAAYLLVINVYTFSLMGMDKKSARKQRRRVPEQKLFLLSAAGGAIGTWLAMKAWRHKTKHRSFTVGIPFLFGLNILLVLGAVWLIGTALNS
ncbi:uncharacterized membrane protein YsdA (DUF1294 family) [Paenibacillus endophyticus]|uniref:Uncharacterized membrane protein YsdA (DUF1294 family) n=1 Tax=Paenibacillus endophyticus TaxID=1294268 RepID=A0A7W5G9C0_9BACL|nr:DUF1294 domain-containing protein [Paenibacillus endophyticus]MBB3151989.1 uncharacterized membrane protein YsdA (DUF1294 family) [Paenibacillus endophyticus]